MNKPVEFRFIEGDCLEEMARLPDRSFDLVVTSPPYNLGIDYAKYRDRKETTEYLDWSVQWALQVKRVLKENGSFFLNIGAVPSRPLLPHQLVIRLEKIFVLQNTFHWIKSIAIETRDRQQLSVGHFKPLQSTRFITDCHEFVFHLTETGRVPLQRLAIGVPYADKSNIARWGHTKGRDLRCRGNTWFIPYQTIHSRTKQRPHPATFPVELAVQCIKLHGTPGDLDMLDPFVGIGHSALAAKKCGVRSFTGIDIDAEYLGLAAASVEESGPAPQGRPRSRGAPASRQQGNLPLG